MTPDPSAAPLRQRRARTEGAGDQRRRFVSRPDESAAACAEHAAADRLRAGKADTAHGRERYEQSAERWDSRAALLTRLEHSFYARQPDRETTGS